MKITILSRGAKIAVFVVLLAIFAALLWGASELHYQSCVTAAEARTAPPGGNGEHARTDAVAGCSHLPF
jgi:hypothetical protein